MIVLQLTGGVGYLLGHYFLSRKSWIGWGYKIIGGSAWTIFLFLNENYIFMTSTIMVVLTMFYGLFKWRKNIFDQRTPIDKSFEVLTLFTVGLSIIYFLIQHEYSLLRVLETVAAVAEISGTMLLARKYIFGWYAYIVMSLVVASFVIFINPQPAVVIGILELLSIYFYIVGIRSMR